MSGLLVGSYRYSGHISGLVGEIDIHGSHIPGMLGVLNIPGWRIPGLLIDEQVTLPSLGPHLVSFRSWFHSHLTNTCSLYS